MSSGHLRGMRGPRRYECTRDAGQGTSDKGTIDQSSERLVNVSEQDDPVDNTLVELPRYVPKYKNMCNLHLCKVSLWHLQICTIDSLAQNLRRPEDQGNS